MNNILIENYRGYNIEFNTGSGTFRCVISDDLSKDNISFSSIKKFIDDYKKTNSDFTPFFIEKNYVDTGLGNNKNERLKVIGIRKDGRFVAEKDSGEKFQITDYDSRGFILYKDENQPFMEKLNELDEKRERQRLENNKARKEIISCMNIVSLSDIMKNYK